MKTAILFTILTLALAASCTQPRSVGASLEQVDIVVNKSNSLNSLSREEARRIFMGEKSSWPGGKHITVLMLAPGHVERALILREVYEMNESDYTKYFLQEVFTGHIQFPPKDITSAQQMKAHLAANPGAIGYLSQPDVDGSLKVLLVLQ